jgi:hypothetical protein
MVVGNSGQQRLSVERSGVMGYPLPLGGIFVRKISVFSGLHGVDVCKILITDGLGLKYL